MPASHVYVRHLSDPDGSDDVRRLLDPRPRGPLVGSVRWRPSAMLDPAWVTENRDAFDLFHLHFGFDAHAPAELVALVATLRECGKPLVYTVHDLRNPHHLDPTLHREQLDVLIPAAAALITLTAGAGTVVTETWGRQATVIPHPHVVPESELATVRESDTDTFTIGVHAKSLRPQLAPVPIIQAITAMLPDLPGARLRVDVHREAMTPGGYGHDQETVDALRSAATADGVELAVHDLFSDRELWHYLAGLDLSVLPYWFGTHSGWLEACHDLGTPVAAPSCGFYSEQRRCLTYRHDEHGLNAGDLAAVVRHCYTHRPAWRADPAVRRLERRRIAERHREIYEGVLNPDPEPQPWSSGSDF